MKTCTDAATEASFKPTDAKSFNHGSALKIGVITGFICQQLDSKCKAPAASVIACKAGATAAAALTGQAAADAFNAAVTSGAAVPAGVAVVADAADAAGAAGAAAAAGLGAAIGMPMSLPRRHLHSLTLYLQASSVLISESALTPQSSSGAALMGGLQRSLRSCRPTATGFSVASRVL